MTTKKAIEIISKVDICANAAETARDMAIRALSEREEIIKALNEALIMDNRHCFDDENFPCGHRQWCGLCDENEEYGCALAYVEWLRGHGEGGEG